MIRSVHQRLAGSPASLRAFGAVIAAGFDADAFAHAGIDALAAYVGSDLTTLSDCDLVSGRRHVVGRPSEALSADAVAAFDRHFRRHPLVAFHAGHPQDGAHRISDSLPQRQFRSSDLYNEYYREIGIAHAIAVPLYVDGTRLVSFVLNRARTDFSDDECAALDVVRGPLAAIFRQIASAALSTRGAGSVDAAQPSVVVRSSAGSLMERLTPRELEVIEWVAAGKSDAQVATIIGAGVRTVQKHLQNVYAKLGVEGRTAAAMRLVDARGASRPHHRAS